MKKPLRGDDKYWVGTNNFLYMQYDSDLEDYITELEYINKDLIEALEELNHNLDVMWNTRPNARNLCIRAITNSQQKCKQVLKKAKYDAPNRTK